MPLFWLLFGLVRLHQLFFIPEWASLLPYRSLHPVLEPGAIRDYSCHSVGIPWTWRTLWRGRRCEGIISITWAIDRGSQCLSEGCCLSVLWLEESWVNSSRLKGHIKLPLHIWYTTSFSQGTSLCWGLPHSHWTPPLQAEMVGLGFLCLYHSPICYRLCGAPPTTEG